MEKPKVGDRVRLIERLYLGRWLEPCTELDVKFISDDGYIHADVDGKQYTLAPAEIQVLPVSTAQNVVIDDDGEL